MHYTIQHFARHDTFVGDARQKRSLIATDISSMQENSSYMEYYFATRQLKN